MVDAKRLIKPEDDFRSAFPGLNFRNRRVFVSTGEKILLVDPIYLADVYNENNEIAFFLRKHGLFLMDFGGDTTVPVWWKSPYMVMPMSMHLSEADLNPPKGAKVLTPEIGCDSGSFVFLPLRASLPTNLASEVKKVLKDKDGVALPLPAGRWTAYYEQYDPPQKNLRGLYRNVVLKHTSGFSRRRNIGTLVASEPGAAPDRGRHTGFARHDGVAGGPGR